MAVDSNVNGVAVHDADDQSVGEAGGVDKGGCGPQERNQQQERTQHAPTVSRARRQCQQTETLAGGTPRPPRIG
jgi:hypothetical protein